MLVGASTYNLCLFKQAHWEGAAVCALKKWLGGRKPGLVDSKLDSRSKGRAFESYTKWKWSQSHAR